MCGNATPEPGEGCDDGNTTSGDGCDENCKLEDKNNCVGDRNCKDGLICNVDRKCVIACQSDLDCDGKTCDSGRCINCVDDMDCAELETCNLINQCEAKCENDAVCQPSGFCEGTPARCAECRDSLDCLRSEICTEGICEGPACNPNDANCDNICLMNSDCKVPGLPQCETENKTCVECFKAEHCTDGEICDRDFACKPACNSDADCEAGKCNLEGQCVACLTNEDCEKGECSVETNKCEIVCEAADDCENDFYCSPDRNLCVEGCENDTNCVNGTCNTETHKCIENTKDEKPPLVNTDEGCGCSSTQTPKFPMSMIFFLGILLLSRKRK